MKNKRFDKKLYERYDRIAKEYTYSILNDIGYDARESDRKYGVDVIVYKNDEHIFNVECEIKTHLNGNEEFKYSTLRIPERKTKFCKLEKPTLFILFSESGHRYFCVWDKRIINSPLLEIPNVYISYGEYFYDIPMKWVDNDIEKAMRRKWKK